MSVFLSRVLGQPELIGPPDCPLIWRWTLINRPGWKVLLHHFPSFADDRDVHDHPRPFWTFVFRGGYDDLTPSSLGFRIERMRAPKLRFRPASHAHRTRVHKDGCWSLVLMGPKRREWGFWRAGRWWFYKEYEREFGFGMRCE